MPRLFVYRKGKLSAKALELRPEIAKSVRKAAERSRKIRAAAKATGRRRTRYTMFLDPTDPQVVFHVPVAVGKAMGGGKKALSGGSRALRGGEKAVRSGEIVLHHAPKKVQAGS